MTLLELRNMVKNNLGGRTDKNDLIDSALNLAYKHALQRHFFQAFRDEHDLTLTQDALSVALPANTFQLVEARLKDGTSSFPLLIKSKRWITSRYPKIDELSSGRPVMGYVENQTLYYLPPSDDDYTLTVTVVEHITELSGDSDEPSVAFIEQFLISWATAWVLSSVGQVKEGMMWSNNAEIALRTAISADERMIAIHNQADVGKSPSTQFSAGEPWLQVPEIGANE